MELLNKSKNDIWHKNILSNKGLEVIFSAVEYAEMLKKENGSKNKTGANLLLSFLQSRSPFRHVIWFSTYTCDYVLLVHVPIMTCY